MLECWVLERKLSIIKLQSKQTEPSPITPFSENPLFHSSSIPIFHLREASNFCNKRTSFFCHSIQLFKHLGVDGAGGDFGDTAGHGYGKVG